MKTTEELKDEFFELLDLQKTYNTILENADDEKGDKAPHLQEAEKDYREKFEKIFQDLLDSESTTPKSDDAHTPQRPFVLFKDEIKYNDGSTVMTAIKP